MKPHVFRARPIDSSLKPYEHVCAHVQDGRLCVERRESVIHIEPDAMGALERRMEGVSPHAG